MDDTFVIVQVEHSHQFLQHINSIGLHIEFTIENPKEDGSISFLDTLVSQGPNNIIITSLYRKPTHIVQCIHLGEQPHLTSQIQCVKYSNTQGKGGLYQTIWTQGRAGPHQTGTPLMQLPITGLQ